MYFVIHIYAKDECYLNRCRGIRERNTILVNQRRQDQQQRYSSLVADLTRESACWITMENMNEKICDELFQGQCTTGFVSRGSQFWRYEAEVEDPFKPISIGGMYRNTWTSESTPETLAADDHTAVSTEEEGTV
jgi:hypothetical protein